MTKHNHYPVRSKANGTIRLRVYILQLFQWKELCVPSLFINKDLPGIKQSTIIWNIIKTPYPVNAYNEFMIFDIMWVLFPLVSFLFNYIQLYFFKSSIEFLLVTDGVHLVFHNLIANYCTKQHAKCLSAASATPYCFSLTCTFLHPTEGTSVGLMFRINEHLSNVSYDLLCTYYTST